MKNPASLRLAAAMWLASAAGTLLPAQDIIVGEITIFADQKAVDQPPVRKRPLNPTFPRDLKSAADIGYVMTAIYLDAKAKHRGRWIYGTLQPYARAVDDAIDEVKTQPAQRDGKPVDLRFWQAVIFNPASAAPGRPEATPRLLYITPVFSPDKKAEEPVVVPAELTIDEQGQAGNITVPPHHAQFQAVIAAAATDWKFSPGRKAGQPQAATIRLSVVVQPAFDSELTKGTPPELVRTVPPVYPHAMANSGLRGEVAVQFIVSTEGMVTHARILESNNPGFNEAALEAIRKWKFKPARVNDEPKESKLRQLIIFDMDFGGTDAFTVERTKPKKGAPLATNLPDVPAKPRGVVLPVYPYELLRSRTKGSAEVRMIVNAQGRVVEVAVVKSTHPEFGLALAAAVQAYAFNPALKAGKPVPSALSMTHEFDPSEIVSDDEMDLLDQERKGSKDIVVPTKMADVPKAISQSSPAYPPEYALAGEPGRAVIEFLIDRKGRPRLPRVVSATKPGFGYAAVQAIYAWRFEEPKIGGKSVILRLQMPMEFELAKK